MLQSVKESIQIAKFHYNHDNLNYPMLIFISLAHLAAIVGIHQLQYCSKYTLLFAFLLWPFSGKLATQ